MTESARTDRGNATREKILQAAEEVFATHSFAASRLEDVAIAVGIRRASLVYYFKSKQELYEAVEARVYRAMIELTEQRLSGINNSQQKLITILDSWLDFQVSRPTAGQLIMRNIADQYPSDLDPIRFSGTALALWDTTIREAQAKGEVAAVEPQHLLQILAGGILHYVNESHLLGKQREYDVSDNVQLEKFRALLHQLLRAVFI
ncbi:TetR/AcrR family transcriptional regulator [Oceanicoccus sp. KOV_DT_Chl]|uniref:TetR/AcrR family transcriptional regulator n=1 Tax=Oceanicoccus sp. KOV_DT_Chl TaxID=1904639 RepID=UPI000C7A0C4B|nr:TetR/AcrR family transcriptional regulator [Oceanicoccus sp. KOV_DT_Chl]